MDFGFCFSWYIALRRLDIELWLVQRSLQPVRHHASDRSKKRSSPTSTQARCRSVRSTRASRTFRRRASRCCRAIASAACRISLCSSRSCTRRRRESRHPSTALRSRKLCGIRDHRSWARGHTYTCVGLVERSRRALRQAILDDAYHLAIAEADAGAAHGEG